MDCEHFIELLEDCALGTDGAVSDTDRAAFEEHLRTCAACREKRQVLGQLATCVEAVQSLADKLPADVVAQSRQRIEAALRADAGEGVSFWSMLSSDAVALRLWACAACSSVIACVLALVVVWKLNFTITQVKLRH